MQTVKERQHYWLSYIKKRYARFFWYSLIAFIMTFLVTRVYYGGITNIVQLIDALSGDIWEILLVEMTGLNQNRSLLNVPDWTLSCMLLVQFFVLGMLTFLERSFLAFLMPLSVICGLGYWINAENVKWWIFHGLFTFGVLRIYISICMGMAAYWLSKKLKTLVFSGVGRWIITIFEVTGYGTLLLIALYRNSRYYSFCFILIATFILALSFSQKSLAGSMLPATEFTNFCAEFSLGCT